ncbi:class I SAM-dependent methyltransferase [Gordonia sp. X0973]|uniref:class I SAM-dependent methyltransferase n=1 Tax=Gordonia sp. X0973 TaxID=2742602 RepID=UPI000F51CA48|nr:class I SAM-dependent methyltransferase [Gordonia sp. X0973]QKT07132.1 class I SAM-dependent methyltransferase [Gordonia sp. X0973]
MSNGGRLNGPTNSVLDAVARQLSRPHGLIGRSVVARMLDRGNGAMIRSAVDALRVAPGQAVADVGFGGGAGLEALLAAVGPDGRVIGCDASPDMLGRAESRFAGPLRDGRLSLTADIADLADAQLDALMCVNTIYFVDDLTAFLRAAAQAIRGDGRMVIGIGRPEMMRKMPFTRSRFTIREVDEIVQSATEAGFVAGEKLSDSGGKSAYDILGFSRI